ncbi:DoxX family membrane protein [Lunatibacter salilacus]|uniref:DoxX family membrane protein n=1 Tax=Lunatibacter salilacus TaxID=2483804 RepID=UPI00131D7A13|nr:DoxX family membrane protein [Lunatibacter salilacus]
MNSFAYLLVRLTIGMSMFGHGLVRIPKLTDFSEGMVANFEGSLLPVLLVRPFSYALPFLEFIIGLFLFMGFKTVFFARAGGMLMVLLIFGTSIIENWSALPSQMIHASFFIVLLQFIASNNYIALDAYLKK